MSKKAIRQPNVIKFTFLQAHHTLLLKPSYIPLDIENMYILLLPYDFVLPNIQKICFSKVDSISHLDTSSKPI